jgi:hypothetical protein
MRNINVDGRSVRLARYHAPVFQNSYQHPHQKKEAGRQQANLDGYIHISLLVLNS